MTCPCVVLTPCSRALPVKIHFFSIKVMLKMGVMHGFHLGFFCVCECVYVCV